MTKPPTLFQYIAESTDDLFTLSWTMLFSVLEKSQRNLDQQKASSTTSFFFSGFSFHHKKKKERTKNRQLASEVRRVLERWTMAGCQSPTSKTITPKLAPACPCEPKSMNCQWGRGHFPGGWAIRPLSFEKKCSAPIPKAQ